jgi:hypothetical protein
MQNAECRMQNERQKPRGGPALEGNFPHPLFLILHSAFCTLHYFGWGAKRHE